MNRYIAPVITATLAAGVAANHAPVAQANTTPNNGGMVSGGTPHSGGTKAPEFTAPASAKELALNAKAQKAMDALARRIINGKVDEHGGTNYVEDANGKMLADSVVTVAGTSGYDGRPAGYRFDVLSDVSSDGEPVLSGVKTVSMASGEMDPTTGAVDAYYTSLSFVTNVDTGAISVAGNYFVPKIDGSVDVEASAIPSHPAEAHLTDKRLGSFVLQANQFITGAIRVGGEVPPVNPMAPAITQPAHTIPVSLK